MFSFADINLSLESWILILAAILLGRYYVNKKFSVLKKWSIPHDPPSVLKLGNMKSLSIDNPFTYPSLCKAKYGPIYGYYVFTEPRIAIHDVDILRRVLVSEFSNFSYRDEEGISFGCEETTHGLFSVRGKKWKRIRTTLSAAFTSAKLKQMTDIINWSIDNTLELFNRKVSENSGKIKVQDVFNRLSLDVICSTAFSTDVNSQDDTKGEPVISMHAKKFFKYGFQNLIRFFCQRVSWLESVYLSATGVRHVNYFRTLSKNIAHQRASGNTSDRVDLMQLMLDSKISESESKVGLRKGLTSMEIIGNAISLLLAGYETTAASMMYLAYNLATHPAVQEKLQAEIDGATEKGGRLDFSTVSELKYLDMCINETLRLYCPVPWTVRTAKESITIKGLRIPKHCVIGVPIYSLCHDTDFWDSPMEFTPERMENLSDIDSMIFQPFGAGPRNCIGYRFAMTEMKVTFSRILQRYTFEATEDTPKPPLKLIFGVTTRPKDDFSLRIVPRS